MFYSRLIGGRGFNLKGEDCLLLWQREALRWELARLNLTYGLE